MHSLYLETWAVILLATFVRSAFGFGEALVAVPLLVLWLPLREAAPLAVMVSVTVAALILLEDHQSVHLRSAGWLVAASVFGIPCGLLLLTSPHARAVKLALGAIIVLYALFTLLGRQAMELRSDHRGWLLAFGFAAGVLGGAFGMNGPPLAVYGTLRRWPAAQFRATLQAYFLPASLMGLGGFWFSGVLTPAVWHDYLVALPAVAVALPLGRWTHRRMRQRSFLLWIHAGLAAIGLLLISQVLRAG